MEMTAENISEILFILLVVALCAIEKLVAWKRHTKLVNTVRKNVQKKLWLDTIEKCDTIESLYKIESLIDIYFFGCYTPEDIAEDKKEIYKALSKQDKKIRTPFLN